MKSATTPMSCDNCGKPIGNDHGPKDGWQLEDGKTVCHSCCVKGFREFVNAVIKVKKD